MATKEIIHTDSSNGIVIILLLAVLIGAFIAYQNGAFSNDEKFEINLPGGKEISGSVSQ